MTNDQRPFLHLPFKKQPYKITEGWYYSKGEQKIHGFRGHGAVDFALPCKTPVLAAASGWAVASYHLSPVFAWDKNGKRLESQRKWQGKPVFMGMGRFVRIYHPNFRVYTQYAHLSSVAPKIPFRTPRRVGSKFIPVGQNILIPENLGRSPYIVFVKAGEEIGKVGDTGLGWGYQDYPERPNSRLYPSWDEVHLHFEVFTKTKYGKKHYLDSYGIKDHRGAYPDSLKKGSVLGIKGPILWLLDKQGWPRFID